MPLLQPSIEQAAPSYQDPYDWDVDQVIFYLTDLASPLLKANQTLKLPDAGQLANILRENDVNGLALLTEIDRDSLKQELGITSFAHRASINQMIRSLKASSVKYREQHSVSAGASSAGLDPSATPFSGSPHIYDPRSISVPPRLWGSPAPPYNQMQTFPWLEGVASYWPEQGIAKPSNAVTHGPHGPDHERPEQTHAIDEDRDNGNTKEANDTGGTISNPQNGIALDAHFEESREQESFAIIVPDSAHIPTRLNETTVIDSLGRKRRRLGFAQTDDPNHSDRRLAGHESKNASCSSLDTLGKDPSNSTPAASQDADISGAPIPPDDELSTDTGMRRAPTQLLAQMSSLDTAPQDPEPGVLLIDGNGKKRMRPVPISQPLLEPERNQTVEKPDVDAARSAVDAPQQVASPEQTVYMHQKAFGRKADRKSDQIYLGPAAFPVDDMFYAGVPLEAETFQQTDTEDAIDATDHFAFASNEISKAGIANYVNPRMKYYLQSKMLQFQRGGRDYVGIVPYPSRIIKRHHPLSMTLFSQSANKVLASRSNRAAWIEAPPGRASKTLTGRESNGFDIEDPELVQIDHDDAEWKALEKWKFVKGDSVLPVYGESGSEGEYELDTWKEIEQERGELTKPLGPSRSRILSAQEVQEAIEESVKHIIQEWSTKKEPKLRAKAYRLWVRAHRDGTTQLQIDNLTQELEKLHTRISALRNEIAAEEWSKSNNIVKQCKILQPSIFDHEDCRWKIAILSLQKTPEKPPPGAAKPKRTKPALIEKPLEDDEEDLLSNAYSSESSDDGLDDFIVEDPIESIEYQPAAVAIDDDDDADRTMADSEDLCSSDKTKVAKDQEHVGQAGLEASQQLKTPPTDRKLAVKVPPLSSEQHRVIDLTLDSDPIEPEMCDIKVKAEPDYAIKTPPLHGSGDESDVFQRSRTQKAVFRKPPPPEATNIISLESDSTYSTTAESPLVRKNVSPPFTDVDAIHAMDPLDLVERQDRKRLLIWIVAHTSSLRRKAILRYVSKASVKTSFHDSQQGLQLLLGHKRRFNGTDESTSDSIMSIATWRVCWTIPTKLEKTEGIRRDHIDVTLAEKDGFETFHEFLLECLGHYRKVTPSVDKPKNKRQKITQEDSDEDMLDTPIRKRKFAVVESQETLGKRQAAQDRVREDEERRRRRELQFRFTSMGSNASSSSGIMVNPGKRSDQEAIYLNPKFGNGAHIKPHQIEGLQFLWREITSDHKDLQGCLLAQTMGLGKTMQVIALLLTIAEAAQNSDVNIRHQVPSPLRKCRTLIICPPALLENWWDEFIIWVPRPFGNSIGEVRKISASLRLRERCLEIEAWGKKGGVLLIGYDAFRGLIQNVARVDKKSKHPGNPPLGEDQHRKVKDSLLRRTSIVIADEAHGFKARNSKINDAMNKIITKSRIALTGSPLNNNLSEYYTLIDWISPNYLGTPVEFKATYEEPIRNGLYQESTPSQYRESRKRLKALEIDMAPKVHRADVSVLHSDLQGKMEFVIKVPLTELQKEIYTIAVEAMRKGITQDEAGHASLWSWLIILQLLCNHPKCFRDYMLSLQATASDPVTKPSHRRQRGALRIIDEGSGGFDEDIQLLKKPAVSQVLADIITESEKVFAKDDNSLEEVFVSNKMAILMKILRFSGKAQDKVLVFSHRLPTLDYVETQLSRAKIHFERIDGESLAQKRQQITRDFNEGAVNVCLVSTRAGGTGLNMFGANRVVIMDEFWNPMWERQAIGRAYRIGQRKPVYVYRLTATGTFEEDIQNQGLFKEQLADRVVDQKNANRNAVKKPGDYFYEPKTVESGSTDEFIGKDPLVLDNVLAEVHSNDIVSIIPSETFHVEDGIELLPDELKEAEQIREYRRNPQILEDIQKKRVQTVQDHTRGQIWPGPFSKNPPLSTQPNPKRSSLLGKSSLVLPPSTAHAPPTHMGGLPHSVLTGNFTLLKDVRPHPQLGVPTTAQPGPKPILSASVHIASGIDDALASEVDDLFDLSHYNRAREPSAQMGILQVVRDTEMNSMYNAIRRSAGTASPSATPENQADWAMSLCNAISERCSGQAEFQLLTTRVSSIFRREGVDPKTLFDVLMNKLSIGHVAPPASLIDKGPGNGSKEIVGRKDDNLVAMKDTATKKKKAPGGMLSYLNESTANTELSNLQEDTDGSGLDSGSLPKSNELPEKKTPTNPQEHHTASEKEKRTNNNPMRKHSLLVGEEKRSKKQKRAETMPKFLGPGENEDMFMNLLDREADGS